MIVKSSLLLKIRTYFKTKTNLLPRLPLGFAGIIELLLCFILCQALPENESHCDCPTHVLKSAFEFKRQLTKDMITMVQFCSYFIDLQLRTKVEIRIAVEQPIHRSKYPNRRHRYTVLWNLYVWCILLIFKWEMQYHLYEFSSWKLLLLSLLLLFFLKWLPELTKK